MIFVNALEMLKCINYLVLLSSLKYRNLIQSKSG